MKIGFSVIGVAALVGLLFGGTASADEMVKGYLVDGAGRDVTSSAGDCWRHGIMTAEKKVECGYPAPQPAPQPEVVTVTQEVVSADTAATVTTTVDEDIALTAAILFGFDDDRLSEDGKAVIDERIGKYRGRVVRSMDLEVTGHTDSIGSEAYNQALSLRRAQAVADYINAHSDIPHNEIKVIGKGESEPVASNDTPEGRAANRRVVVHVEGRITQ